MTSSFSACPVCEFGNLNEFINTDGMIYSECNKCYAISAGHIQSKANKELKLFGEPLNWDLPNE